MQTDDVRCDSAPLRAMNYKNEDFTVLAAKLTDWGLLNEIKTNESINLLTSTELKLFLIRGLEYIHEQRIVALQTITLEII